MARARRLERHPLTRIERGPPVTFRHEGRGIRSFEGETVAAALLAEGQGVLSRSMRYHRARGLYCGTGGCTHCFLRIDGQPNRRSCLETCTSTTWSEGQNAIPNVRFDLLATSDLAFPHYLDAHRRFVRPAFLRPFFLNIIRRMAGFGKVPRDPVPQAFRRERLDADLLVVGSGPAGMAAADAARGSGANVLVVEAEEKPGGRLRMLPTPFHAVAQEHAPRVEGKTYAEEMASHLARHDVDVRTRTRVFGVYDGTWAAATPTSLVEIRPKRVVVATGAIDEFPVFPGADRAGVLLPAAALRLLNVHGIAPPDPVLIYGATRDGLLLARDFVACGVRVVGVYHPAETAAASTAVMDDVRRLGVPIQLGHRAAFIAGRTKPRAVVFDGPRGRVRVRCGTVVAAVGRTNLGELFQQAGAELVHDAAKGGFVPIVGSTMETTVKGVYAAGSVVGVEDEWSSVLRGRIAGSAAALSLRPEDGDRKVRLQAALDQYESPSL